MIGVIGKVETKERGEEDIVTLIPSRPDLVQKRSSNPLDKPFNPRMTSYIFTFSFMQMHPVTKERLDDKYVRVSGYNFKDARRRMVAMFGYRFRDQFETEYQAQTREKKLTEIQPLAKEDWSGGLDGYDGLENLNWVRGIGW